MSLSKREKNILAILLVAVTLFVFYRFVCQPKAAMLEAIDAEIAEDEILHARLEKNILEKEEIEASISSMKIKVNEMNRLLPMRIYQEEIILYMEDLLYNYGITVENISFSTDSLIDGSLKLTEQADSVENLLAEYEEGRKPKTLEELKKAGEEVPETDSEEETVTIRQFETSIDFSGEYLDIKDFMDEMESNNRLIGIRNINIMSNEGVVSGNMLVSFPFYDDGSLNELVWKIDNSYGKPDLFKKADSSTWVYGYTPDMTEFNRSDFYLFLDPNENVLPTSTMGKTPYNYTAIYNNATDAETIRLVLRNDDSSYSYRYENSSSSFPSHKESFTEFEPTNGKVFLNVYVRSEETAAEIPGAKLLVDNQTGLPLYIHVIGDNPADPAFEYESINGDIRETRIP
ncbi:MAG: hypothetical protein C0604_06340 [Clostridiales bacterium]|nr:MAG: hypothetical protein C0604_06340 [Clostridiales bacterium]